MAFDKFRLWLARKIIPVYGDVSEVKFEGLTLDDILKNTAPPLRPGQYRSFSGVDTKVFYELENGETVCLPETQVISIQWDRTDKSVTGTMCHLNFNSDVLDTLESPVRNIELKAADEYGPIATMKLYGVQLRQSRFAISIDDIVSETWTDFTADNIRPWKKAEKE